MKHIITAAVLTVTASMAHAGELSFNASAEYAVEAETYDVTAGAVYAFNDFAVFTEASFEKLPSNNLEYTETELGIVYNLKDSVSVYGLVRLDSDFEYDDTVVGVAVTF